MERDYINMLVKKTKIYVSPLEPEGQPELDESKLLDNVKGIKKNQSIFSSVQAVAVQLGRLDIATATRMTLLSFRAAPWSSGRSSVQDKEVGRLSCEASECTGMYPDRHAGSLCHPETAGFELVPIPLPRGVRSHRP
jgi:hypothetical protein